VFQWYLLKLYFVQGKSTKRINHAIKSGYQEKDVVKKVKVY